MSNLISSELFKIRKGKTLLGIAIGLILVTLLISGVVSVIRSPELSAHLRYDAAVMDQSDVADMDTFSEMMPNNVGEYLSFMYKESGSIFALLLLPLVISIFASDYRTGAFRNLLSHSLSREKIYMGKLLTTLLLTVATVVLFGILNAAVGLIMFGIGGMAIFVNLLKGMVLILPLLTAFVCVGHCIVAFTKSSGNSIAVYLVGALAWSTILQIGSFLLPGGEWIMNLDLMSQVGTLFRPDLLKFTDIATPLVFAFILIIGSVIMGINRYKATDFDFN